jgi:hypothetical protein
MTPPSFHPRSLILLFLPLVVVGGCHAPEASARKSSGEPESALTTYRVSGMITDESGAPIPLASVVVDQGASPHDKDAENRWVTASTSHDGRFELVLNAARRHGGPNKFGLLRAWTENEEFRGHTQRLDWQETDIVTHVRLRRIRTIDAGQSIDVTVGPDSPLCESGGLSLETVCEWVRVRYSRAGTLTVGAHSESGTVPTVRGWMVAGAGTVSFPVSTGRSDCAEIAIAIPVGSRPQRFSVTTSLTQQ